MLDFKCIFNNQLWRRGRGSRCSFSEGRFYLCSRRSGPETPTVECYCLRKQPAPMKLKDRFIIYPSSMMPIARQIACSAGYNRHIHVSTMRSSLSDLVSRPLEVHGGNNGSRSRKPPRPCRTILFASTGTIVMRKVNNAPTKNSLHSCCYEVATWLRIEASTYERSYSSYEGVHT